jgi:hypothetical protein
VRGNVQKIFDYRYDRIREMFGGPPRPGTPAWP